MSELLQTVAWREEVESRFPGVLNAAHDAGWTWPEIADAIGRTASQVTWAAKADQWESVQERRSAPRKEPAPRAPRPPSGGPGVSVIKAAELLGITRKAVYDRIDRGEVEVARNEAGHLRVLNIDVG